MVLSMTRQPDIISIIELCSQFNLVKGAEFKTSRKELEAKRRDLKQKWSGNGPNTETWNKSGQAIGPIQPMHWAQNKRKGCGRLGNWAMQVLLHPCKIPCGTWNNKILGHRSRHESRQVWLGQKCFWKKTIRVFCLNLLSVKLKQDLVTALISMPSLSSCLQMQQCPVEIYKTVRDYRPLEMLAADAPFYLPINMHWQKK